MCGHFLFTGCFSERTGNLEFPSGECGSLDAADSGGSNVLMVSGGLFDFGHRNEEAVSEDQLVSGSGGDQLRGALSAVYRKGKRMERSAIDRSFSGDRRCFSGNSVADCRCNSPFAAYQYAGFVSGSPGAILVCSAACVGVFGICTADIKKAFSLRERLFYICMND